MRKALRYGARGGHRSEFLQVAVNKILGKRPPPLCRWRYRGAKGSAEGRQGLPLTRKMRVSGGRYVMRMRRATIRADNT